MKYVLAIDQSTSATKAVLFDTTGRAVDRESRDHQQIYPQPGWVEHDAEEIWQNTLSVLQAVAQRNAGEFKDVTSLAITNQRETFVVFDRESGRPLHNAIVWQCRRGDPVCRELESSGRAAAIRDKTGLKLDTYFSGPKIKWLIDANPQLHRRMESSEALVGTIDAYLVYRLTGGAVFVTDSTNASRTLLFDIHRLVWDEELCSNFGVPRESLPEVRESFAEFGMTDAHGSLPRELPICGVMGDSQASLLAHCCFERGMAKATFGSGTSVLLNTGDAAPAGARGAVVALAWVQQGRPVYALEGLINYSSATIDWLKNQLGLIDSAEATAGMAMSVDDNAGVYLVPAFAGLSAPYWSNDARAAVLGMTAFTRKEHLVRAALEAIAYQIRDVLDMMRSESGVSPRCLYVDGGPTRNEFLMQFTADMTQLELVVSEVPESSARGAAMAAMLGQGLVESLEEFSQVRHGAKTYRPAMRPIEADRLYAGWRQAVGRVL
jgi:glycerol kinase